MQLDVSSFRTMKIFIALLCVGICASQTARNYKFEHSGFGYQPGCVEDYEAVQAFRNAYDSFGVKLFKKAAPRGRYFFSLSPHSTWMTLAAIAEGADSVTQQELFKLLELPNDPCTRQKFYQIGATRVYSPKHVSVTHNKVILLDKSAQINPEWNNFIRQYSLLDVISAPIKQDPSTTLDIVKQIITTKTDRLDLSGNSVLLNSMDYDGLWSTAFSDAVTERSPFYSVDGTRTGSVDLMRVRRKARVGYVPSVNLKVVELPIGDSEEYSMVFAMVVGDNPSLAPPIISAQNYTIIEILSTLQDSPTPIDVAIPRFVLNSEINLRDILEDMGIKSLWRNPEATRYISTPPAAPSSFIQRVTVSINNSGVKPSPKEYPTFYRNKEEKYWGEFIADRPFMFGLFDTETYTCLIATLYTQPTYPF